MISEMKAAMLTALVALLLIGGCTSTRYPAETEEGLVRTFGNGFDAVYRHPTSELGNVGGTRVEPCTVEFRENWLRDQNRERDLVNRVEPSDMRRIEGDLATSCTEILRELLEDGEPGQGGPSGGPTLILQPRIIDLDVTAPDIVSPSAERDYVRSVARMTLVVDLLDGSTDELLGRVIDHRSTPETARLTRSTRNANLVEMERLLEQWASLLAEYLGIAGR
ncbi:MAG: hypothetical protein R3338_05615 [Thermoanaerobaculia bacterium]|nr:hypothetical protein [Thermoanaerobaculia bacterium]